MHRAGAIILLLLVGLSPLFAQEDSDDPSVEIDWDDYVSDLYTRGDQTFILSLGVALPVVFLNNGDVIDHKFTPPVGGTGSLSYNYYFSSNLFAGAEIRGMFLFTISGGTFFSPQVGVRAGYQFNVWRLEFPLALSLGLAWHTYLSQAYCGLYIMGSAAAFFRVNPEWSFGLTINWGWLPEWPENKAENVDGNILDIMISARYHF
jgi:hypothetical protein